MIYNKRKDYTLGIYIKYASYIAKSYPFINETVPHTFVSFISFATTKYSFLCILLLNLNPRSITLKEINNLIVNVFACAQFNGLTGILGIENS